MSVFKSCFAFGKLKRKFSRCLMKDSGESLVETLVSTLIIVAVFLMLCTAVVSAAKVNTAIKPGETVFDQADSKTISDAVTVTVTEDATSASVSKSVTGHVTDNGYLYYEQ